MTLSVRLRRVAAATVDSVAALIDTLHPTEVASVDAISWAELRARPTVAASRAMAERMLSEADDAFARLDAMQARHAR